MPPLRTRRNEIEGVFGRIERVRRAFTRYDETDVMFTAFVAVALPRRPTPVA